MRTINIHQAKTHLSLPIKGEHTVAVLALPPIHGDPFDRLLLAQGIVEHLVLLMSHEVRGGYEGPIWRT